MSSALVKQRTAIERFWEKVDRNGPIPECAPDLGPCWIWTAGRRGPDGYGGFTPTRKRTVFAHRYAYELLVGPIPDGLELDHLCRVRPCVNPSHLEPVTHRENVMRGRAVTAINARKTHCPQGHPYSGANLRFNTGGDRVCRACHRKRVSEEARRRKSERRASQ